MTVRSNKLPVSIGERNLPIIAIDRWQIVDSNSLRKTYRFNIAQQRRAFLVELLAYEDRMGYLITELVVREDEVDVWLSSIGEVTNLDKTVASYCDSLYRDVICCNFD